jgi:beta-N-acetylhexosaminidase
VVAVVVAAATISWLALRDGSSGAQQPWAVKLPPHLTVAQLAGLRVVASFRTSGADRVPASLSRRIRAGTIGAVCLFAENGHTVGVLRRLTRTLQAIPRPAGLREPLLIMIDQEGGKVRRITNSPPAESALSMATHDTVGQIRARGVATGRGLRRAGVNVDLAPVSDIPRSGSTLLQFQRTFGGLSTPPAKIGADAAAFASGLVAGGAQATAKHFPGFGDAEVNSDLESVTIPLSAATLRNVDEKSFAAVVKAGARLVMVGNAIYPALDPKVPATLSRKIAEHEVRDQLGFKGVTITDDLEAGALKQYGTPGQIAVKGVAAGDDLVLFARNYKSSVKAGSSLTAALKSGKLSMSAARASAERILALRQAVAAAR